MKTIFEPLKLQNVIKGKFVMPTVLFGGQNFVTESKDGQNYGSC
jgi:hypothetical protein